MCDLYWIEWGASLDSGIRIKKKTVDKHHDYISGCEFTTFEEAKSHALADLQRKRDALERQTSHVLFLTENDVETNEQDQ